MKRLIKYTSPYEEIQFSDCSTKYEVLPYVVEDTAGSKELGELAKLLGFDLLENVKPLKTNHRISITHSVAIEKKTRFDHFNKIDERRPIEVTRLGFITLSEVQASRCGIEVNVECEGALTEEQSYQILNNQAFDFQDFIELDGETVLNIDSRQAFHHLNLLGYSFDKFLEQNGAKEYVFSDSVFSCSQCGDWDDRDNGYTYNHRIIDGECLGTKCGCYDEYMKNNWEDRIDDTETPIEKNVAKKLEKSGKIEHLERFIGGMTDGRGGWYDGKPTREGSPDTVLEEYQKKIPGARFIFTHDESGQFQTYFSIYKVKES